jgi:hypothetical protein
MHSNVLDNSLYEHAKIIIDSRTSEHGVAQGSGSNKNTSSALPEVPATSVSAADKISATDEWAFERFQPLVLAVLAYPEQPWHQPERTRKLRLELALAVSQQSLRDSIKLAAILDPWYAEERSRPLREDIERARKAREQS